MTEISTKSSWSLPLREYGMIIMSRIKKIIKGFFLYILSKSCKFKKSSSWLKSLIPNNYIKLDKI